LSFGWNVERRLIVNGGRESLARRPIAGETEACEAERHRGPGGRFRDCNAARGPLPDHLLVVVRCQHVLRITVLRRITATLYLTPKMLTLRLGPRRPVEGTWASRGGEKVQQSGRAERPANLCRLAQRVSPGPTPHRANPQPAQLRRPFIIIIETLDATDAGAPEQAGRSRRRMGRNETKDNKCV
jgi:hypothetical protein